MRNLLGLAIIGLGMHSTALVAAAAALRREDIEPREVMFIRHDSGDQTVLEKIELKMLPIKKYTPVRNFSFTKVFHDSRPTWKPKKYIHC